MAQNRDQTLGLRFIYPIHLFLGVRARSSFVTSQLEYRVSRPFASASTAPLLRLPEIINDWPFMQPISLLIIPHSEGKWAAVKNDAAFAIFNFSINVRENSAPSS